MRPLDKIELNGCQQTILDLYRITAAIFVLLGHSFSFYQCTLFKNQASFAYLQNIGVVIFFLLSGFLTAFSLEKKNKDHSWTFQDFFIYKVLRFAKEYIPGLMIIALTDAISIGINENRYLYSEAYNIKQFIGNLLMLHNMGPNSILGRVFIPFGSGRQLWTMSVEWWMIMLFGAVFFSISNQEKVSFRQILLFGTILFMISDYLITGRGGGLGFVFTLGILSYYSYWIIDQKTAVIIFIISLVLYIGYGAYYKDAYTVYSFLILWLLFTSAIAIGQENRHVSERNSALAFLSKSTFMLYLVHYSIIDLLVNAECSWGMPFRFVLGIMISILLSLATHFAFGERNLFGTVIKELRGRKS